MGRYPSIIANKVNKIRCCDTEHALTKHTMVDQVLRNNMSSMTCVTRYISRVRKRTRLHPALKDTSQPNRRNTSQGGPAFVTAAEKQTCPGYQTRSNCRASLARANHRVTRARFLPGHSCVSVACSTLQPAYTGLGQRAIKREP